MRPPRPLEPGEIQRERDEYVAPTPTRLSKEEKEQIRVQYGRSLYVAYYDWIEDPSAYLSEDDQYAYLDEIVRLARIHFRDSQDEDIKMLRANQYVIDHAVRFEEIKTAMHFRRYKLITPEEKELYLIVNKFRSLPPEEIRRIGEKELAAGIELLPPKKRDLYKRWARNKYRGNWFEITMKIIDLAEEGFFDEDVKADLLKRAHALKNKITELREKRINKKAEDIHEGDVLIQETLEQLFPTIKGLEGEERKKELGKLLGIPDEVKS